MILITSANSKTFCTSDSYAVDIKQARLNVEVLKSQVASVAQKLKELQDKTPNFIAHQNGKVSFQFNKEVEQLKAAILQSLTKRAELEASEKETLDVMQTEFAAEFSTIYQWMVAVKQHAITNIISLSSAFSLAVYSSSYLFQGLSKTGLLATYIGWKSVYDNWPIQPEIYNPDKWTVWQMVPTSALIYGASFLWVKMDFWLADIVTTVPALIGAKQALIEASMVLKLVGWILSPLLQIKFVADKTKAKLNDKWEQEISSYIKVSAKLAKVLDENKVSAKWIEERTQHLELSSKFEQEKVLLDSKSKESFLNQERLVRKLKQLESEKKQANESYSTALNKYKRVKKSEKVEDKQAKDAEDYQKTLSDIENQISTLKSKEALLKNSFEEIQNKIKLVDSKIAEETERHKKAIIDLEFIAQESIESGIKLFSVEHSNVNTLLQHEMQLLDNCLHQNHDLLNTHTDL